MQLSTKPTIIQLVKDQALYYPNFYCKEEADLKFNFLFRNIDWQEGEIKLFGKIHDIPRLQAWYGDKDAHYKYSNIKLIPLPWTKELLDIKIKIELLVETQFNSVLLNLYRNGQDSNGWHSDDEKELGINPIIASITLGQDRTFQLKHKREKIRKNILLENGSLLIMTGAMQHNWKHQIPKTQKPMNPRINLTFRRIIT